MLIELIRAYWWLNEPVDLGHSPSRTEGKKDVFETMKKPERDIRKQEPR
jgi:hypothetical protein